jgi:hypothetical protein
MRITAAGNVVMGGGLSLNVAANADNLFTIGGSFTGRKAMQLLTNLTVDAGSTGYAFHLGPTITEAGSGTHGELAGLAVDVAFVSGSASVTKANVVSISGSAAPSGTTNASTLYISTGMSAATNNYALFVDAGTSRFDGDIDLNSSGSILNVANAGNDWTAAKIAMIQDNTGGDLAVQLYNTATSGNSSATISAKVDEGSSRNPAFLLSVEVSAGDTNFLIALDNDQSDRFSISNSNTVGTNDALRISNATPPEVSFNTAHSTIYFDYVCESCGKHQAEVFNCCGVVEWHDDIKDFRAMASSNESAMDYMEKVGVIQRTTNNEGEPEVFTTTNMMYFVGSMAYQNRQRMDTQYEEMVKQIKELKEKLLAFTKLEERLLALEG